MAGLREGRSRDARPVGGADAAIVDAEFSRKDRGRRGLWTGLPDVNPEGVVWFTYAHDGYIDVKNPNEDILHKMHQIACRLNARVRGEEGEEYGEFGKMTKPPPHGLWPTEPAPRKSLWQRIFGQ
jgi:hypothetical protein